MEATETSEGTRRGPATDKAPSVSSSLEHLVAGSQSLISKRIDLALLEGREMVAGAIARAVLAGLGIALAAGAWFAASAGVVMLLVPSPERLLLRLVAFALLSGAGAVVLFALSVRQSRSPVRPLAGTSARPRVLSPVEEAS